MVGIGTALAVLGALVRLDVVAADGRLPGARCGSSARWWRRGRCRVVALIAGWVTTEVGRQPWVVYEVMRTEEAVTGAGGIPVGFAALVVVYVALAGDRLRDAPPARLAAPFEVGTDAS